MCVVILTRQHHPHRINCGTNNTFVLAVRPSHQEDSAMVLWDKIRAPSRRGTRCVWGSQRASRPAEGTGFTQGWQGAGTLLMDILCTERSFLLV